MKQPSGLKKHPNKLIAQIILCIESIFCAMKFMVWEVQKFRIIFAKHFWSIFIHDKVE